MRRYGDRAISLVVASNEIVKGAHLHVVIPGNSRVFYSSWLSCVEVLGDSFRGCKLCNRPPCLRTEKIKPF